MTEKELKFFKLKLSKPTHISYISTYILKKDLEETKQIVSKYIEDGSIQESKYAKEYFVWTKP
jgi:hypothetical protein